jgi:hypothetical protein
MVRENTCQISWFPRWCMKTTEKNTLQISPEYQLKKEKNSRAKRD